MCCRFNPGTLSQRIKGEVYSQCSFKAQATGSLIFHCDINDFRLCIHFFYY